MQDILPLLFLVAIFVGFYLLIIRPAQRRQREAAAVINQLVAGQEVMTTAGIYGTLRSVDDESVLLEVAPGTVLKYAKVAIARIITDPAAGGPGSHSSADAGDDERGPNA